ncbi:Carboxylic ester hydrolase [Sergentomyia squamirostris]
MSRWNQVAYNMVKLKSEKNILWCFTVCNLVVTVLGQCEVSLQQAYGTVYGHGLLGLTPKGYAFCSFLGIPYAEAPVGLLRFEPPQPIDLSAYTPYWDFQYRSPICIQNTAFTNETEGQEDCLYLNVYTKPTHYESLKPVIVWIHGGFFNYGSAYTEGADNPDYLVDEDIVVVTFNYRLGILGFLYREEDDFVGNLGLRDQLEALKWVQKNIKAFGGDPKRVTVMGWSAGGASITYHIQSPSAHDLFHGAVLFSGVNFTPWAYQRNTKGCLHRLCESIGVSCNRGELKTSLKSLPEYIFKLPEVNHATKVSYFGDPVFCFVPRAEDYTESHDLKPIIREQHHKLHTEPIHNDVPVMIGYTVAEIWSGIWNVNRDTLSRKWNYSYPYTHEHIIRPLRLYLLSRTKELNNYSRKLVTRSLYLNGIQKFADYYSNAAESNTYLFRFSYKNQSNDIGSFHGDDLRYVFKVDDFLNPPTDEEDLVRIRMVRYISNFVKHGDPTPVRDSVIRTRWHAYSVNGKRMDISAESKMERDVKFETFHRWEAIIQCLQYHECQKFFVITSDR